MPFRFVYVCDLLEKLERPFLRQVPLLPGDLRQYTLDLIMDFFKTFRDRLNLENTDDQAVLSMLQPENETDRVYGLDAESLQRVLARVLNLSRQQYVELRRWKESPEYGDLSVCLQRIMGNTKNIAVRAQGNSVTVEEIDQALLRIAAFNPNSSPAVQSLARTWSNPDEIGSLGNLYRRLQAREAKWLTRLILKSYAPVKFPENWALESNHSYLPNCLQVRVQLPGSRPAALRRQGTGFIKANVVQGASIPPPTPRTSSAPHQPPSAPTVAAATVNHNISSSPSCGQASSKARARSSHHPPTPSQSARQPPSSPLYTARTSVSNDTATPTKSTLPPSSIAVTGHRPSAPSRSALSQISPNTSLRSRRRSRSKSSSPPSSQPLTTSGTGTCQLTSKVCPLTTCVFLLSPCISTLPWLTENLLPCHGCRYITAETSFTHPSISRRHPKTGKRYRKMVLIESNRVEESVKFLKQVGNVGLRRKGKKEWVEVYDWRLLECITKAERGKDHDYNPWKRCWIGAV